MDGTLHITDDDLRTAHRECKLNKSFDESMRTPAYAALIHLTASKNLRRRARQQEQRLQDRKLAQANDHD